MQTDVSSAPVVDLSQRRSFVVRLAALVVGGIVSLFPFAVGIGVVLNPLRRRRAAAGPADSETSKYLPVCPLDALPADGTPRQFAVISDVNDAWTHAAAQRIGVVFLSRSDKGGKPEVTAFTATCPHLGCAVEFDTASGHFECPCHKSGFDKDGKKLFGPSRRGLDPLPVKIMDDAGTKGIAVEFERFQAGIAERKPIE